MKKCFIISFVLFLSYSSAYAIEYFFEKSIGYWTVIGHPGNPETNLNPACITTSNWPDGSYIHIIQDLSDGELLIEFKSNEWNIIDVDLNKIYEMTINVYSSNKKNVQSWPTKFKFLSKNTISIRGLDYKKFLPAFMDFNKMIFIMPGTIQNAEIELKNSTNAISLMTECFDSSPKQNKIKNNGSLQLDS